MLIFPAAELQLSVSDFCCLTMRKRNLSEYWPSTTIRVAFFYYRPCSVLYKEALVHVTPSGRDSEVSLRFSEILACYEQNQCHRRLTCQHLVVLLHRLHHEEGKTRRGDGPDKEIVQG